MGPETGILTLKIGNGEHWPTEEHTMAMGPDKHQELADRINAAALDPRHAEHGARFIVPWRMDANRDLPLGPIKEHDSCSAGECGCGISRDEK